MSGALSTVQESGAGQHEGSPADRADRDAFSMPFSQPIETGLHVGEGRNPLHGAGGDDHGRFKVSPRLTIEAANHALLLHHPMGDSKARSPVLFSHLGGDPK